MTGISYKSEEKSAGVHVRLEKSQRRNCFSPFVSFSGLYTRAVYEVLRRVNSKKEMKERNPI